MMFQGFIVAAGVLNCQKFPHTYIYLHSSSKVPLIAMLTNDKSIVLTQKYPKLYFRSWFFTHNIIKSTNEAVATSDKQR
jgi:hypothetical protein